AARGAEPVRRAPRPVGGERRRALSRRGRRARARRIAAAAAAAVAELGIHYRFLITGCYSYAPRDAAACLRPDRGRGDRRAEERQPAAHRTNPRQRSRGRSRLRFAPGARSDRRARGSLRHFDSAERRSDHAHRRPGRRASGQPRRRAAERVMWTLRTLPEALADAARSEAGICFQSGDAETWSSYSHIRRRSLQVARALRDAGLRRGDLVALVLPDGEQFLTTLFGASIARLIPASLYPPATTGDLPRYIELTAAILNAAEARAVITSRALAPAFADARAICPRLSLVLCRDDLEAPPDEPADAPSLDDIAFVQYTSGSTSTPKGVVLTHANLAANVNAII